MAQKVTVSLIDDLDQSGETVAHETVEFGLDGVTYEIDLSSDNSAALRNSLADFKAKARKAGSAKRTGRKATSTATSGEGSGPGSKYSSDERKEIRQWALDNGADVAQRGRMGYDIYAAWEDNRNVGKLPRKPVEAATPAVPTPAFTG